jgi:cell volume regulation protein A
MIETMYLAILISAGLILAAVLTTWVAFRFGAPLLLIFLAVGLLAGEDGLGLEFDNFNVAYFLGSLALAVILFDSGFGTRISAFRQAAAPAIVLASLGVVLTTALVGAAARFLFGFPWLQCFLLGAVVSSTDAAAVFFLLRVGGIHLRDRVRSLLEVESGCNDPTAIFLTGDDMELISGDLPATEASVAFALAFLRDMGLGLILGLAGGFIIVRLVNRLDLESSLYPIAVLAASLVLFGIPGWCTPAATSPFTWPGSTPGTAFARGDHAAAVPGRHDLARPDRQCLLCSAARHAFRLPEVLLPSIALALFLIFVRGPVAIWSCLLPLRFPRRETAFVAWVGCGAPSPCCWPFCRSSQAMPRGQEIFNATFIVVLAS